MKNNFTTIEVGCLANAIKVNTNLSLRINACGNIDVKDKRARKNTLHFVFYKWGKNDYFIRRRTSVGDGRGINQHGSVMNGGKHFASMKDMANYFSNYIKNREESLYTEYRQMPRTSRADRLFTLTDF